MNVQRLAATAVVVFALGACSIGQPMPTATTYGVEPPLPPAAVTRRPETLRMGEVRVAPAFSGNALVYRLGEVQYRADFYNAFIAEPGALLGTRIAQWLDRAGPFRVVNQPGSPVPASFALEGTVTELYGDFRPGRAPSAVMTIQFTLVDLRGIKPTPALERSIGRRVELAQDSPDALVRGYGQALDQILAELAPQIAEASAR